MLLRRTLNHANQRLAQSGRLMDKADDLVDLGKAIASDLKDGGKLTFVMLPGFSRFFARLILALFGHLVDRILFAINPLKKDKEAPALDLSWLDGQTVPIGVSVDIEYDALPPAGEDITFSGGSFDGKTYKGLGPNYAPGGPYYGRTRVTMEGTGEEYLWNGYVMEYWGAEPPSSDVEVVG